MIQYPQIDPVLVKMGPLAVRWYGLMYIFGFTASYLLSLYQVKKKALRIDRAQMDDLYFYLILGLIVGARLGYVLFYNLGFYFENPLEVFVLWHGGMSFHGGLIGSFIAGYIVIKKKRLGLFRTVDLIIPTCPVGIGLGRLGNFINGELFGKPSDAPWAMIFPQGGAMPRHPSQLYEAFLEGLVLFTVLWLYKDRKKREGDVFALFIALYGTFRFFCEFFREPDLQVGYILGFLTMGQVLSGLMVILGFFLKYFYLPKVAAKG
jgi:phosphatidylglycerol---prolipoprotein diacylglyceryl transferase